VLRAAAKVAASPADTALAVELPHGGIVWCKAESLQPMGAFKIRGHGTE